MLNVFDNTAITFKLQEHLMFEKILKTGSKNTLMNKQEPHSTSRYDNQPSPGHAEPVRVIHNF